MVICTVAEHPFRAPAAQLIYLFIYLFIYDATASITYSAKEDVKEIVMAKIGDSFRLHIELIGGTTFKIMGMMFCNRWYT